MTDFNYKKIYEDTLFEKISIQKEFQQFRITQEDIINKLNKEIDDLKEHLKKYTAPERNKKYYENIKKKLLNKLKLINPHQKKLKNIIKNHIKIEN